MPHVPREMRYVILCVNPTTLPYTENFVFRRRNIKLDEDNTTGVACVTFRVIRDVLPENLEEITNWAEAIVLVYDTESREDLNNFLELYKSIETLDTPKICLIEHGNNAKDSVREEIEMIIQPWPCEKIHFNAGEYQSTINDCFDTLGKEVVERREQNGEPPIPSVCTIL